jgi:hypothetical protein
VLPTVHGCHYAPQKFPFFCVTLYYQQSDVTEMNALSQTLKMRQCAALSGFISRSNDDNYRSVVQYLLEDTKEIHENFSNGSRPPDPK